MSNLEDLSLLFLSNSKNFPWEKAKDFVSIPICYNFYVSFSIFWQTDFLNSSQFQLSSTDGQQLLYKKVLVLRTSFLQTDLTTLLTLNQLISDSRSPLTGLLPPRRWLYPQVYKVLDQPGFLSFVLYCMLFRFVLCNYSLCNSVTTVYEQFGYFVLIVIMAQVEECDVLEEVYEKLGEAFMDSSRKDAGYKIYSFVSYTNFKLSRMFRGTGISSCQEYENCVPKIYGFTGIRCLVGILPVFADNVFYVFLTPFWQINAL